MAIDGADGPRADQEGAGTASAPVRRVARLDRRARRIHIGTEIVAAIVPAVLLLLWSTTIDVNPLVRVGQVSGIAQMQLRFAILALVLVAVLLGFRKWGTAEASRLANRLGCAAVAGLSTGLIAGGVAVAVHGTPWALWIGGGDYTPLMKALQTHDLRNLPPWYPPLFPTLMGGWATLTGQPIAYGLQALQLFFTAMFGPAAYLSWRLILRPFWALAIGVVAMLPFLEPVKPYAQLSLIIFLPVVVALLRVARRSADLTIRRAAWIGVAFGVGLGLLFLFYSGWYVWCAPGLLVAFAVITPWRTARNQALVLAGSALGSFVIVSWVHLRGLLNGAGGLSDNYFYFDTCTDPAYIAMWRNDRPFGAGEFFPPLGELGGVGLFTVLLTVGAGVAIVLAWRRTVVLAIGASLVGAWLLRMWLAGDMYATQTVRLYPRTTMIILYGLLVLTGLAVCFLAEAGRRLLTELREAGVVRVRLLTAPMGLVLVPLLFLFASAGSATVDKYMPNQRADSDGYFTWIADTHPLYDGSCAKYAGDLCGAEPTWGTDTRSGCGPGQPPYMGRPDSAHERRSTAALPASPGGQ